MFVYAFISREFWVTDGLDEGMHFTEGLLVFTSIQFTFASTSPISTPPSWWKRIVSPCLWE